MSLPTPPAGEPAWSVCTLAEHLALPEHRVYITVCDYAHDHSPWAAFHPDSTGGRMFDIPWQGGTAPLEDAYLTDPAVQHVRAALRDGVIIPGVAP